MLTAWDTLQERLLVLPDYETREQLEAVREHARRGELLCPTCRQLLWLRAGDVRSPHFGHRSLNDCPATTVSEAVLAARRQLYRFFRSRIDAGKLPAEVDLEPQFPPLAKVGSLDLLLRRVQKPPVAIGIVEHNLKPDARAILSSAVAEQRFLFRPVFLQSRLKPAPDASGQFLLDPTQRELRLRSPYDLRAKESWVPHGTLHFIDAIAGRWTTLRGISLVHEPQVFTPIAVRTSTMAELLWTEAYSEWVHPGEAEALKAFREAEAEKVRRAQAPRASEFPTRLLVPRGQLPLSGTPPEQENEDEVENDETAGPELDEVKEEMPSWLTEGLVCTGCGQRTTQWQNASPGQDRCVCRSCFQKGVRLT